ncbi:GumC family protein [Salipiger marinus]|uniref:Uncharacterized protein involved in exopolysaccharide biosynthesis n=1 Tax=Salipiger marinus TaxID=555512 RepID=A0A1G8NKC1_9RHOB|nr:Wzz/FepE/Etk N-terminal domain-containing protein [Salipiger marinus]SDI80709.1 Uncharacterized protein involved in exopolysaccharide biosynthesis [Salipiger marinus]
MTQFQSFEEILAALRRRMVLILLVTLLGCGLSVAFALQQQKMYEATAVVQIEEGQVSEAPSSTGVAGDDASRKVQLIEQRLMSRDNLLRIMDTHQLFTEDPAMPLNQRVSLMREAARIEEIRPAPISYQAVPQGPSGILITVRLSDAQKAADVANELMTTVIEESRSRSVIRARETLSFFESEATRVAAEMDAMTARIAAFKQANAEALPSGVGALRDQLGSLEDSALEIDREIVAAEGNSARVREEVQARQLALLREQKQLIDTRMAQIEETIRRGPEVERTLSGMERDLTQLQDQYSVITRRRAEAEMGQMLETRQQADRFEVLEAALVPEVPSSQSRQKLALMGGVASLMAGLFAGVVAELMNPVIRNAAQLERATGVQAVVSIPVVKTRGDRRRRGLGIVAGLLGLAALFWGVLRVAGAWLPQGLLDRILPRASA